MSIWIDVLKSFIKSLSKLPSGLLEVLGFFSVLFTFFASIFTFSFILHLFIPSSSLVIPLLLLSIVMSTFGAYKLIVWTRKAIEQYIRDSNSDLIVDTDMPSLCLDMLEAVQQKHRHSNNEAKLDDYSDWMDFQVKNGNHKMMGDVALGIKPSKLDEIVKNSFLTSAYEGKRGAYDTPPQAAKDYVQNLIVTFDNVLVYRNKVLDWLLAVFIEINLISQINLMKDVFDHKEIRVKLRPKALAKRSRTALAELHFELDDEDQPTFREIIMMHAPFNSFVEIEMEDVDKAEVIKFMQKFIKDTRKLVRKV